MPLSARHIKLLVFALLSLVLGMLNYFFLQSHISIFELFSLSQHRPFFIQNNLVRRFFTGYFSDITWCCSLCLVTVALSELKLLQKPWKVFILALPVIIEFAQYFHFITGVFDWYDILIYVIIIGAFGKFFSSLKL